MAIGRFDVQSDQRILNATVRTPSPDVAGATRLTITMPWGDDYAVDVEKLDLTSATSWCNIVRSQVNEFYVTEENQAGRRNSSPTAGGSDTDDGGAEDASPEPADEAYEAPVEECDERGESVPEDATGHGIGDVQLDRLIRNCESRLRRIEQEAREVCRQLTMWQAAKAALEVFDESEDDRETGVGVQEPECSEASGVGQHDEDPAIRR